MSEETIAPEEEQGEEIAPVEEKLDTEIPAVEQKQADDSGKLPEEVSSRTKSEFEKLRAHNKQLSEKLSKFESQEIGDVFSSIYGQNTQTQQQQFPNLPQGRQQEIAQSFVDANGYVDVEAISRALKEANEKASRAEADAKYTKESVRRKDEKQQVSEAHEKYPWLNPENHDQFDPQGFELVRDRVLRNMVDGREQTLAQVASEITKFYKPSVNTESVKEQAVTEYKEKQTAKAQASAVQTGKGQPREDVVRLDELRKRTQLGDQSALDERLKNI